MKCCGEDRQTPFCPMCGKPVRAASPLYGLLRYIQQQQAAQESCLRTLEENDSVRPERLQRRIATRQAIIEKWKSWGVAVEEAIAKLLGEPKA